MKFLRLFGSTSQRDAVLASIDYKILQKTEGVPGVELMQGTYVPEPDYTIPFYIDVRGAVTLDTTAGLQMSTDGKTWTDTAATTLSSGKTYFRVADDQSSPLKPNWTEDGNSDYDVGGNINSLVKVNFENDTTCYSFTSMFRSKSKLKSAGKLILPATTLANNCYQSMFHGCTSLTSAPALPATTLAQSCYITMFLRCTSLTSAPALPATTLAYSCYTSMFDSCTSLTVAPVLPATTLVHSCYLNMFYGCTNLNYIKCLATDISATSCTTSWLSGVAASGTFIKNANMSSWSTDENGIPSGWTVQDVFPFTLYAFPADDTYGTVNGLSIYERECTVGDHVTLTVAANQNYTFIGWEDSYGYPSLSGVGPTFEFDITQAIYDQVMNDGCEWYLSASYVARQVNVSLVAIPENAVTSIEGVGQMSAGSETYLNFEYDDNHWLWLGWSTSSSEDDILPSHIRPLSVTANEDTTLYTLFRYKQ